MLMKNSMSQNRDENLFCGIFLKFLHLRRIKLFSRIIIFQLTTLIKKIFKVTSFVFGGSQLFQILQLAKNKSVVYPK